jgi:hypothetical protein
MTEREQRDLAERLAEGSEVLDFEMALKIARYRPVEAEKVLRMREEHARSREERARAREGMRRALREEFG